MKIRKPKKPNDTIEFLQILALHYPKMVNAPRRIYIWDDILLHCQQNGFLLDRDSQFLYQSRWPSMRRTAHLKWKNKKTLNQKDKLVIAICQMVNPDFCKDVVEEKSENEEVDDNDDEDYAQDDEDGIDSVDGDFDIPEDNFSIDDDAIKDVVEYMVSIVSGCQDVVDSMLERCEQIPVSSLKEINIAASTDEHGNAETSVELSNVLPPTAVNFPPIPTHPQYYQGHYPHSIPSLTYPPPPPPPHFYSPDIEKAHIAALQAYTTNCQWSTYKIQLEIEALNKATGTPV